MKNLFWIINILLFLTSTSISGQDTFQVSQVQIDSFHPLMTVSTKSSSSPSVDGPAEQKVLLTVSDNGPGIPKEIKEKIFQPFFTTKPTGSGTGLGLSLSYHIVKAHGGELKVESMYGKGTVFIIQLA